MELFALFCFVQLIHTLCVPLCVFVCVLEALKVFVVGSADFNNKLAGRFPLRQVEIKSDFGLINKMPGNL